MARFSRALVGAALVAVALAVASPARAHVFAWPVALPEGDAQDVTLSGRNERTDPMTEFSVTAPAGVTLEHAHPVDGWTERLDGSTATWSGGPLPADADLDVLIRIRADVPPGPLELQAEQRYADGERVLWPVRFTVTPGSESPSQNLAIAGMVALIGMLLVVAVALLAWRRRGVAAT